MGLLNLLFPRKCVLCSNLLAGGEREICAVCSREAPAFPSRSWSIPHVAKWTAVYRYEANVRSSLLRYKFGRRQHYARFYGRVLAEKLRQEFAGEFDCLTYVPVSFRRRLRRGYDQVELLVKAMARELDCQPVKLLKKVRHNRAQSTIEGSAQRRANVLGAYRVLRPEQVEGKRILLIDDIITTGATVSECAKVLQMAGAKRVLCLAVAARKDRPMN